MGKCWGSQSQVPWRSLLGGTSSAASEAPTVAPPSPVVKARRWPLAERRGVEAEQARRRRGGRYCFARPSAGRCRPSATTWRSWPQPTSATSGGCSSPAPPTTLLVLVHLSSELGGAAGARSVTRATAPGVCSPSQLRRSASAFGLHRRRRRLTRVHAKAELRPIGNDGRSANDTPRLEIGESQGRNPVLRSALLP